MKEKILITSATGKTGYQAAMQMLENLSLVYLDTQSF